MFSISSVLIYFLPQSDTQVKSYSRLNLPRASLFNFEHLDILLGRNRTLDSKVIVVWIFLGLTFSISSVSIYHDPQLDILVKSYGRLNLPGAFMFSFEHLDVLWALIRHPIKRLWLFEFFGVSVFNFECLDILRDSIGCPSKKLLVFEFALTICSEFWASWYTTGYNWTSE